MDRPITPVAGKIEDTFGLAKKLCAERNLPCTLRVTPLGGRELEMWLHANEKGIEKLFKRLDYDAEQI